MKNYSSKKNTYTGRLDNEIPFVKKGAVTGKWAKGALMVRGYLKTFSEKFKNYQYSLYLDGRENKIADTGYTAILLNVPEWYGKQLEEDFLQSGQTAEDFFEDAYVESIETVETKFGTNTTVIRIYE